MKSERNPGPITNLDIFLFEAFVYEPNIPKSNIIRQDAVEGKDFVLVPDKLWEYWNRKYEGMDIKLVSHANPDNPKDVAVNVYYTKARIIYRPKRSWMPLCDQIIMYVNERDTGKEIRTICEKLNADWILSQHVNLTPGMLKHKIWKISKDTNMALFDQKLKEAKIGSTLNQIEIEGKEILDEDNIQSLPFANNDIILVECNAASAPSIFKESKKIPESHFTLDNASDAYLSKSLSSIVSGNENSGKQD